MTITIPPKALEAGARVIHDMRYGTHLYSADDIARAAFLAMVEAWPGMEPHKVLSVRDNGEGYGLKRIGFILPLPQEKPNE